MKREWLLRTQSNQILGPMEKAKVVELYQNGSIKGLDEVCSGNGYWFTLKEESLVEKFLLGDEEQGFNPVSEAEDVIGAASLETNVFRLEDFEESFKQSKEQADASDPKVDVSEVLSEIKKSKPKAKRSKPAPKRRQSDEDTSEIFLKNRERRGIGLGPIQEKAESSDRFLKILLLAMVLFFLALYATLRYFGIEIPVDEILIGRASAQTTISSGQVKKKVFSGYPPMS